MGYRPPLVRQFGWGTAFDKANCTAASVVMTVLKMTEGTYPVCKIDGNKLSPPEVRKHQKDMEAGIGLDDADLALNTGFDLDVEYRLNEKLTTFYARIEKGEGAAVQGDYDRVPASWTDPKDGKKWPLSCQTTFDGGHAVYVNSISDTIASVRMIEIGDPLCYTYRWWPEPIFRAYAEKWSGAGEIGAMYSTKVTAPPAPVEGEPMIVGDIIRKSNWEVPLPKGTEVFKTPGGVRLTAYSTDVNADYFGKDAASGWMMVEVQTTRAHNDGKPHNVLGYVKPDAGTARMRAPEPDLTKEVEALTGSLNALKTQMAATATERDQLKAKVAGTSQIIQKAVDAIKTALDTLVAQFRA